MSDINLESQLLELSGSVKNIIFTNQKNGYKVIELIVEDSAGSNEIVVVGIMPLVNIGENLHLTGTWKTHSSFGLQFSVETFERSMPSTKSTILQYLSSGVVKGVGKSIAKKLIDTFGDKTLEIIENDPEKLNTVKGISKEKAKNISNEFKKIFGIKELLAYLDKFLITPVQTFKIWQTFGQDSLNIVKNNPYAMCNEPIFIEFEKADIISESLDLPTNDNNRISAGILYVLNHNVCNGHTCLPKEKLVEATSKFLEVEETEINSILDNLKNDQLVSEEFHEKKFVFTKAMYCAENYSATRLLIMIQFPSKHISNIKNEIKIIESKNNIAYANLQKDAIQTALTKGILILTGGPGTGKTTTLNAIISILNKKNQKVLLAAPTGRAAQRMSQLTGFESKTIHRLLEVEWSRDDKLVFMRNEQNLLKCDALILDEMSMIDILLFESVLRALPLGCRLIMVGDTDQLPSVGAGNVLGDLIKSEIIPVVQLKEIFRQSMESLIVMNAHRIVEGIMPELTNKAKDFFFLNMFNSKEALNTIIDLSIRRLPKAYNYSPIYDIQILCPSRKGVLGTQNLNACLQEKINPASIGKNEISLGDIILREGDKVMQVKNDYDIQFIKDDGETGEGVFNGDVGILLEINKKRSIAIVKFDDRKATYDIKSVFNLELAYAMTVHKSQGNEFEVVVMPAMCHSPQLLYRNLLYTAVTRARSLLILVGIKESIKRMVENNKKTKRYSALYEFLSSNDRK